MTSLRDSFEQLKPHLQRDAAMKVGSEQLYAVAMLRLAPELIDLLETAARAQSPNNTFEALANVLGQLGMQVVRSTIRRGRQREFLARLLDHMKGVAEPHMDAKTGNVILPDDWRKFS